MARAAQQKGAMVTCCKSVDEFGALENLDFDVIIMDYDLGSVTGLELTSYIQHFTKEEMPVIMVSRTERKNLRGCLFEPVREFVHKDLGPFAILDATFDAYEVKRMYKQMRHPGAS